MKKTISLSLLALLGTTLLPVIVQAQTAATPTDTDSETVASETKTTDVKGESMMTSDADQQALMETAQGSVYDRAAAELAVQKARNKSVQRYALRLMDDHNRLNKKLLMQANQRGLMLPLQMSDKDKTKLESLMQTNAGDDFDVAYLKEAIEIKADDVRTANEAIKASTDGQFRGLMRDYVATEQKHLDEASKTLAVLQREVSPINKGLMNN